MDFKPHIKKVRLLSHSPFSYKRYNENLFLAAADDVLGIIFHFSFDPVRQTQYNVLVLLLVILYWQYLRNKGLVVIFQVLKFGDER